MSDISLYWGPLDYTMIALIIGAPGLVIGAALGTIVWRRRRILGGIIGALLGLFLWLGGFVLWKSSPWG
jgi:putative Mn2+ efflux pump MntP